MVNTFETDMSLHLTERNSKLLGFDKLNPVQTLEAYFSKPLTENSVNPNANVGGISPNNCSTEVANPFMRYFFFKKLFEFGSKKNPNFSLDYVWDGMVYVHNSTKLQPYCFGTSATEIATEGRPYGKVRAGPPKRLESFMGQYTEFIMDNSQEFAGAVASTDLVPWMAWFVEKGKGGSRNFNVQTGFHKQNLVKGETYRKVGEDDYIKIEEVNKDENVNALFIDGEYSQGVSLNLYTDKEIENTFQSFVHVLNNNFRVGGDSPFTNVSVNSEDVYKDIFSHYTFPDGKTIQDLLPTIWRVQKIIVEFMIKGQSNGLPYPFPILTANFKKGEGESEWFRYIAEKNCSGNMNINYSERFSMCCRIALEFDFKQNSFGGGGVKIGSMCVMNLNLPRIAYKTLAAKPLGKGNAIKAEYFKRLDELTLKTMEYLAAYRDMFQWEIDCGFLKFFKDPAQWYNINMFFATVGFCGIYDAAEILFPEHTPLAFSERVIFMQEIVQHLVDKTKGKSNGIKFNVEEVPSEAAAGRMAAINADFGEKKLYYSNQFVPLAADIPLWRRIEIESKLQSALTGGGMTFINFESKLTPEQSFELHSRMSKIGFTGQFCINYGYSCCGEHTTFGKIDKCPKCGEPTSFYTRVVGYLAKDINMARTKLAEVNDRKYYTAI